MPFLKNSKHIKAIKKLKHKNVVCGTKSPGPKYELMPVVGYKNHCHSKYRNPSYTIGKVQKIKPICIGPGPNKYLPKLPKIPGYSFPRAVPKIVKLCSPGPKYLLPAFPTQAFTMVGKPKFKCSIPSSGPYDPPKYPPGPSFTFGKKKKERNCEFNPPIRDCGAVSVTKPNSPAFNIIGKPKVPDLCGSPGPAKYFPTLNKVSPAYTFGLKHSQCKTIPKNECDELC